MTDGLPGAASRDAQLAEALWQTGQWEVPHVAAAVVGTSGPSATIGDVGRPFYLASVTKLLSAYACLVAVEEETLDLDEPAGPSGSTVRHLLAHASGLSFDSGPVSRPGVRRIYSNTGIETVADHLASRSGMAAGDYLSAAVFEPLHMTGTDLRRPSLAYGVWSTVGDMSRFVAELLAPTLVHPDTVAAATTVQFPGLDGVLPGIGAQSPLDWGLGFEIRNHDHPHWTGSTNSPETFGHFGATGTFLWVDPAIEHALVVLTDQDFGPWAMRGMPELSDAVVHAFRS